MSILFSWVSLACQPRLLSRLILVSFFVFLIRSSSLSFLLVLSLPLVPSLPSRFSLSGKTWVNPSRPSLSGRLGFTQIFFGDRKKSLFLAVALGSYESTEV